MIFLTDRCIPRLGKAVGEVHSKNVRPEGNRYKERL